MRTEHAHRRLGFRTDTVSAWLAHAGLEVGATRTIDPPAADPPDASAGERLSVCLWQARNGASRPAHDVAADDERARP
jgi:hypothetical protein